MLDQSVGVLYIIYILCKQNDKQCGVSVSKAHLLVVYV